MSDRPAASAAAHPALDPLAPAVSLRPIGSPLPLGFLALAVATFTFASLQLGWVGPASGKPIALVALVLTAPTQLVASILAFHGRDSVVGTGMGLLAGTWAAVALTTLQLPPGALSDGLGVVLLAAGSCLLVPAWAAYAQPLHASVIGLSAVRFAVTGIAELDGSTGWLRAAGWLGLALAAWALLVALVLLVRRTQDGLTDEPGVRAGV